MQEKKNQRKTLPLNQPLIHQVSSSTIAREAINSSSSSVLLSSTSMYFGSFASAE